MLLRRIIFVVAIALCGSAFAEGDLPSLHLAAGNGNIAEVNRLIDGGAGESNIKPPPIVAGKGFEHSFFADTKAFAEYESGITSLRQNNILFADVPISGGRFGFRGDDWSASFGRPMHYNGEGKNAAALHYQFSKETGFSFRQQNGNTDLQIEWHRNF